MTDTIVTEHGGTWTDRKLTVLSKYLEAYMTIFEGNEKARFFSTIYFDAFAGSGLRKARKRRGSAENDHPYLEGFEVEEARKFKEGSPRIALRISKPFDRYIFNDIDPDSCESLGKLPEEFPDMADSIEIRCSDGNAAVSEFCEATDWKTHRAVLFLDPFGMQVNWATLEKAAITKAIDMWLLFPFGQAVNRMLTRDEPPPSDWANSLTRLFGTEDWKTEFYSSDDPQGDLFSSPTAEKRCCSLHDVEQYFIRRLKSIFTRVVERPMHLLNSRNTPLFLLFFAAGNPKGSSTAVDIASDVMRRL